MAKIDFKAVFDDSEIRKGLDRIKKEINDLPSAVKPPKINMPAIKPPIDEKSNKVIQDALNGLVGLEAKARDTATRIAELRIQSTDLANAKKELARQFQAEEITLSQYNMALAGIEAQQRGVSQALRGLNKDISQSIQLENAAAGSLEEARLKLAMMTTEITKMGGAMDGSNAEVNEMIARHQELYKQVSAMEQKMGTYQRNVGNYSSGWNGMQHSISQIARELPSLAMGFQTFGIAISNNVPMAADEIKKAMEANKQLAAEGKKGTPIWRQLLGSILSWQTALSVGLTLLAVYGKEIGQWATALFKGKDAMAELKKAQQEFNATRLEGTKNAQGEITSLKSVYKAATDTKLAYKERLKAVNSLQSQYPEYFKNMSAESIMAGKAAGAYDNLKDSIISVAKAKAYQNKISEIASKRLENEDKIVQLAIQSQEKQAKANQEKSKLKEVDPYGNVHGYNIALGRASSAQGAVDIVKKDITDLTTANIALDTQIKRYETAVGNLVKTNGVNVLTGDYNTPKSPKVSTKELNEYNSIMDKFIDIDKEYARQFMNTNEAEVQAVKDKFAEIRKEAEDYNKKNPKLVVDITKINTLEQKAVKSVEYKQDTTAIVESLEEQKALYDDFNRYVRDNGIEAANKQYNGQLDIIKEFKANLEREYMEVVALEQTAAIASFNGSSVKLTQVQEERAKQINKIREEVKRDEEKYAREEFSRMLTEYATFSQKREVIIRKGEEDAAKARINGMQANIPEIRKKTEEELKELTKSTIESLGGMQDFFNQLDNLSSHAQSKGIKAAKATFNEWIKQANLTEKEINDVRKVFDKFFKDAESKSADKLLTELQEIYSHFNGMVNSIESVDDKFGALLNTIAGVVGGILEIGNQMKKIKSEGASFGSFMGIYGAMVQVGTSIFNSINAAVEQRWNDKVLIRTKELEAQNDLLEYQIQLVDALNGTDKLDQMKSNLDETRKILQETRDSLSGATIMHGDSGIDTLLKDLNSGKETVEGLAKRIENVKWRISNLGNTGSDAALRAGLLAEIDRAEKALKFYRSSLKLTGKETTEELIALTAKVDEETKEKIEKIIEYENLLKDSTKEIQEELTGISFKSLNDGIRNLFKEGKTSVTDFKEFMEEQFQEAILNGFAREQIEKQMKPWYDQFAKFAEDGLTKEEMDQLQNGFMKDGEYFQGSLELMEQANQQWEQLKQASGMDFNKGESASGSIGSEGIARATEEQFSEYLGINRAIWDINKQQLVVLQGLGKSSVDYLGVANGQLIQLNAINANTANTVTELRTAVGHLKNIDSSLGRKYVG